MSLAEYLKLRETNSAAENPLNILDLEVSGFCPFSDAFQPPKILREISLGHICAPDLPGKLCPLLGTSKFLILSDPQCQTNFHVDFTSTAVCYTTFTGEKEFVMVKPTPKNLQLLETWDQSDKLTSLVLLINLYSLSGAWNAYVYNERA
jgi:hypothetical protein